MHGEKRSSSLSQNKSSVSTHKFQNSNSDFDQDTQSQSLSLLRQSQSQITSSVSDNLRVVIRIRPPLPREIEDDLPFRSIVHIC